jgi:hypothetical protein
VTGRHAHTSPNDLAPLRRGSLRATEEAPAKGLTHRGLFGSRTYGREFVVGWLKSGTQRQALPGDVMARSYAGLANMAARFGFRLAKAREGSQHLGIPVRYLLEDKNGVLAFRSLGDVERKLGAMAQERARRRATVLQEDRPGGS